MKKIDRDSNYIRRYRLREMYKKLYDMQDEIIGRNCSFSDMILDEDLSLNETKVLSLIKDMLESLERYLELTGSDKLSKQEEKAYTAYLFLTFTGPGEGTSEYGCGFEFIPSLRFKNIVSMLDDDFLNVSSEEALDKLLDNYQGEFGDFLGGYADSFVYRIYNFIEAMKKPYKPIDNEYKEGMFSDDPHTDFVQWQQYIYYVYPSWSNFEKRLPDYKSFLKYYNDYKHLIFEIDRNRFRINICDMVDIYLFEQGISPLSFGDEYGLIDNSMDRKVKHLQNEIKRVRIMNDNT